MCIVLDDLDLHTYAKGIIRLYIEALEAGCKVPIYSFELNVCPSVTNLLWNNISVILLNKKFQLLFNRMQL